MGGAGRAYAHLGARPRQSEYAFPHKMASLHTEILLSTPPPSDDPQDEEAGCGGPGLAWLPMVCDCEAGWMY